jgi:hypothetical protein
MSPALFVIGAQKSGTTALFRYLDAHPQIECPQLKELNFCWSDTHWQRGLAAYQACLLLARAQRSVYTIDASPLYMLDAQCVAPRIYASFPAAGVVALLHEPVARGWSAWQMYRRFHAADPHWFIKLTEQLNGIDSADSLVRRHALFG